MSVDELWTPAIHEGLLVATAAAIAECVKAKGGDPLSAIRSTREAIDKSVTGIKMTATRASGAKEDLSPELIGRLSKLLDLAEERALQELGLSSEGNSVQ
jgi:hypothetical protein